MTKRRFWFVDVASTEKKKSNRFLIFSDFMFLTLLLNIILFLLFELFSIVALKM